MLGSWVDESDSIRQSLPWFVVTAVGRSTDVDRWDVGDSGGFGCFNDFDRLGGLYGLGGPLWSLWSL